MNAFVLSPYAEKDLESIYLYTVKNHGLEQLDVYANKIDLAIHEITQDPLRSGSKARNDLVNGCRFYRVGHHYLAYRVKKDCVEIGRILHASMNFEDHVSDEVFQSGG